LQKIIVEHGKQAKITQADGTKITLDAGSVFQYPETFDGELREVYLQGEGFFEVAADVQKPFIAHAGNAEIEVLGTQFNIRAWEHNEEIRVVVAEGLVAFRHEDSMNRENEVKIYCDILGKI